MVASNVAELPAPQFKAHGKAFDVRTVATLRTLYLVQGMQPIDIERMGLGYTANQVAQLANREGWSETRKLARKKAEESARTALDNSVESISKAIAMESEELCFAALKETRAGLTAGGLLGAKQAQAASSTLKNLAGVAVQLRDPGKTQPGEGASLTLNMFFAGAAGKVEPKQVEKVTDV